MPRVDHSDGLPDSVRVTIALTLARIEPIERGVIQANNIKTDLSRAHHFVAWCTHPGFTDIIFVCTLQAASGQILASYTQEIAKGAGIKGTTQPHTKTIHGYVCVVVASATASGRDDLGSLGTALPL